jgi:hypothetical protein
MTFLILLLLLQLVLQPEDPCALPALPVDRYDLVLYTRHKTRGHQWCLDGACRFIYDRDSTLYVHDGTYTLLVMYPLCDDWYLYGDYFVKGPIPTKHGIKYVGPDAEVYLLKLKK